MLGNITQYKIVEEGGFPTSGQITTGNIGSDGSCVVPLSLESNVAWLHEFLFDEEEYAPSAKVKEISDRVFADTNPYLTGQ